MWVDGSKSGPSGTDSGGGFIKVDVGDAATGCERRRACSSMVCNAYFIHEIFSQQTPAKPFSRPRDDARTEKFLDYFYKLCVHSLLKPIFDIPDHKHHPLGESDLPSIENKSYNHNHGFQIQILSYHGRRRTFIYLYATCYPLSLCNILFEAIFSCSPPVYLLMSPPSYLVKTNISVSVSLLPIISVMRKL